MLYLHGGVPRTSTTSLQEVLAGNEGRLEGAGVLYPKRWRPPHAPTHHELNALLGMLQDPTRVMDDFPRFLRRHVNRDVLISAEALTGWLAPDEKREALKRFLVSAREVMPTRFIWTLRRRDEALISLSVRRMALSGKPRPPADALSTLPPPNPLFAGMRVVEEILDGDVIYVKYDQAGAHNRALIDAFGIPEPVRSDLRQLLKAGPRLNARPSQKQAIALLNIDLLSRTTGVELDAEVLRKAYLGGNLTFDDDRPCELVEGGLRRSLHEAALTAAREEGFAPYGEFFADDVVADCEPVSLDPAILTDDDIQRLVSVGSLANH